jgi:hypothetical protein
MEVKNLKDYGIFSKDDIKKCWGDHDIRITAKLKYYPFVQLNVGREMPISVSNNSTIVYGVNSGKHVIEILMGNKISFTASKNHEFEIIEGGALSGYKPKIVQLR